MKSGLLPILIPRAVPVIPSILHLSRDLFGQLLHACSTAIQLRNQLLLHDKMHVSLDLLVHCSSTVIQLLLETCGAAVHCFGHSVCDELHLDVVFLRGWVGVWGGVCGLGRGGAGVHQFFFWDLDTPQRNPEKILNPQTPSSTRNPEEHMNWEPPSSCARLGSLVLQLESVGSGCSLGYSVVCLATPPIP